MRVMTKPYGSIEVDDRQKIYFPYGLFGFENFKNYVMLDAQQQPFYWLQSTDIPEIAFVLINPQIFRSDYKLDVDESELAEIGITSSDETLCLAIVTIPEDSTKMTANLQGPVVINKRTKEARQMINSSSRWKTRHLILEELIATEKKPC